MAPELASGATVGAFRIESFLARGAMAQVYRARDREGRVVALKLLDPSLAHDERFRQRFLRESELATRLDHPNVVATLASGEDSGRLFLAMELVEGSDLRELLRREGRLGPERAVAVVEQIASALDTAHKAGLVHRDVKPGNILVREAGGEERASICDFGLARHVSSVSSLTGERGFVGTIDYVPPEQIENGTVDERADVYALGCVLYECLTGTRPFERDSELAVIFAHLNEPPPKPTDVRADLPAAFDEVIAIALAKDPDERYSSCGELAAAARAALQGEVLARRKPRRRLLFAGIAAAVAAAVTVPLAVLLPSRSSGSEPVTITPTSIRGARLGDSSVLLSQIWGGGRKLTSDTPANYAILTQNTRNVSAYFRGATDRAVEITTWNSHDRTAEGIGPCSTLADLRRVYGKRLRNSPNNTSPDGKHVFGWLVGKHLFFGMGGPSPDNPTFVETVAIYSNVLPEAGYLASNDGPCAPAAVNTAVKRPTATPSRAPQLSTTLVSRRFAPRITIRAPKGWSIRNDAARALDLLVPGGTTVRFRLDPRASGPSGAARRDVSTTPPGLAAWLGAIPGLAVKDLGATFAGRQAFPVSSLEFARAGTAPAAVPYLAFGGAGAPPALTVAGGRRARLYLLPVRIDALVHTLAIVVDAPSAQALRRVAPAADAVVRNISIAADAGSALSALSSQCTPVYRGTCLGELTKGTHRARSFRPALTYTVPTVDWTNHTDHPGIFGLIPPGGDYQAVDIGKSDYIDVAARITTGNGRCADGHGTARTPEQFLQWLSREPGIAPFTPRPVTVGGLEGFVVDLRMRRDWTKPCPWSHGVPAQQVLTGLPPAPDELNHSLLPQPMVMRLYLLRYRGGTLGIEIDEVKGSAKLDEYSKLVSTFRFAL
jgi:serine/threonine-protein kinase